VVHDGLRRPRDLLETQPGEPRGERAADMVIDALVTRPGEPPVPERSHLRRFGDADGQEVRLDQQDRPSGSDAGDEVPHRRVDVADVVQDRPGGHEIEGARIDRSGDDVAPPQLEIRCSHVHERQVEIDGDRLTARADALSQPGGHRTVAATDLERPSPRGQAEGLYVSAMHRVEQLRHQCQPRALTLEVMVQDVLGHAADRTSPPSARLGAASSVAHATPGCE
jgi:hypothetical protein